MSDSRRHDLTGHEADIVAGYLVPVVVLVAMMTAIVWGLWGGGTPFGFRGDYCRGSVDHRLPLRSWAGNTHVDYGGEPALILRLRAQK